MGRRSKKSQLPEMEQTWVARHESVEFCLEFPTYFPKESLRGFDLSTCRVVRIEGTLNDNSPTRLIFRMDRLPI